MEVLSKFYAWFLLYCIYILSYSFLKPIDCFKDLFFVEITDYNPLQCYILPETGYFLSKLLHGHFWQSFNSFLNSSFSNCIADSFKLVTQYTISLIQVFILILLKHSFSNYLKHDLWFFLVFQEQRVYLFSNNVHKFQNNLVVSK